MGLFASRDDKVKKYDQKLADYDEELAYKKILSDIEEAIGDGALNQVDPSLTAAFLIHHDLKEQNKRLENKLNEIETLLKERKQ